MSAAQVIAVVPARRGSKRLAGKNRRLLDGRSLFDRALDCALESSSIGEVIATTDDPELLAGSSRERMTMVTRPGDLAGDQVATIDVVRDLFRTRRCPDVVVLLQPTSPLRTPSDVDRCVDLLLASPASCRSVVSVCRTDHPVEWTLDSSDGVELHPVFGWDAFTRRSQDHPTRCRPNGAVYAIRTALSDGTGFVGPGTRMVEMSARRSIDIDTALDFDIASAILRSET